MRILIATVTAGAGHVAAASALHETWRAWRPSDAIEQLDLVKFFSPLHRKIVSDGYLKLVAHAPELWGMMFAKTDQPQVARRLNRIKALFPSQSRKRFLLYVKEFNPDAVLCTHYWPLEALAQLKREPAKAKKASRRTREVPATQKASGVKTPLVVSIVTDFEAHALWMEPHVDLYCVAAPETKARLVARGADPASVVPTGIPISGRFSAKFDRRAVRKAMGLRDDLPVLLVLSGGFGMGPVVGILSELDKARQPFQVVVVTGRNKELRRDLASMDRKHPTHVLGFASNMHELMGVADLLITKPGGLTSSEALAVGKPLLLVSPIPGQEAANSDFLLEHGAAAKVNRVEDLPYRIGQLLGSPKLEEMARATKVLGRPHAAADICRAVLERIPIASKDMPDSAHDFRSETKSLNSPTVSQSPLARP